MKKREIQLVTRVILVFLAIAAICFVLRGKILNSDLSAEESSGLEAEISDEMNERIEQAAKSNLPTIIVSDVQAKPGEKVTVTAVLVNNPGILGMSMTLSYDESIMKLIGVKNGEAFQDVLTMSNSKKFENGCVFLWDGEKIEQDQILDGDILILEFQILESAPAGKSPVLLIGDEDGTVDKDLQTLDIAVENGFITIVK